MSKKLYEKMNLYLANQEVAYIKLHNLHWYVRGAASSLCMQSWRSCMTGLPRSSTR